MKQKILATIILTAFAGALALATSPAVADPSDAKLASDLRARIDSGQGIHRVIVRHDPSFGDADLDAIRVRGGTLRQRHDGIGAFSADLSTDEIEVLASDARIRSISPDRRVLANLDVTVPAVGADRIVEELSYSGKGITVALIDSGITPTATIPASRIVASVDFTDGPSSNVDRFGHGTHVAGIIGGPGHRSGRQLRLPPRPRRGGTRLRQQRDRRDRLGHRAP